MLQSDVLEKVRIAPERLVIFLAPPYARAEIFASLKPQLTPEKTAIIAEDKELFDAAGNVHPIDALRGPSYAERIRQAVTEGASCMLIDDIRDMEIAHAAQHACSQGIRVIAMMRPLTEEAAREWLKNNGITEPALIVNTYPAYPAPSAFTG